MDAPVAPTFYKRPLPTGLVPFAADEGRRLFQEALGAGTLAGYFALAEQFHTQADPAFCGLGTLVVVLNALAIDPGPERPWKGPWRWFSEEHLDCCRPLPEIQRTGLTIPQLACLARCNGARVDVRYAERETVETFRQAVREAASTSGEPHLVVSYDRAALGQTGSGHYSPIAGYHAGAGSDPGSDRVLILDVARFKYPPHWVPLEQLYRAMLPHDAETGRSRGFLRLWRRAEVAPLCSLQATDARWRTLLCELFSAEALGATTLDEFLRQLLQVLPARALELQLELVRAHALPELAPAQAALHHELERTEVLAVLRRALPHGGLDLPAAALFLLSLPPSVFRCLAPRLRQQLEALRDLTQLPPSVREQVEHLRAQAEALEELTPCSPQPGAKGGRG